MELVIAMGITAVVSAVLAVLINATAVGTNSNQDGRRSLVKMQGMKARLEDTITNSRCVLEVGTNYIVFWAGDISGAPADANSAVNLSELRLLEVNTTTGTLCLYSVSWPAAFTTASIKSADTTYAANTTWYSACTTAKAGGYFVPTLIANSATGLTASLDSATVTSGRLVSLVISFSDASNTPREVVIGAAIQNPATPW
jgi:hypothetical protein